MHMPRPPGEPAPAHTTAAAPPTLDVRSPSLAPAGTPAAASAVPAAVLVGAGGGEGDGEVDGGRNPKPRVDSLVGDGGTGGADAAARQGGDEGAAAQQQGQVQQAFDVDFPFFEADPSDLESG